MRHPLLTIIILNWNGLDDTLDCLASLAALAPGPYRVQTLVVDNGSLDDPRPTLAARFPAVAVLRLAHNHGFAGGCNVGLRHALAQGSDLLLLLNNDTLVAPDFLLPLVAYLTQHPEVGIVAPLICYRDQPERVWFAGGNYRLALGSFRHRFAEADWRVVPREPFATAYASGCCIGLRASDLHQIGLFDEAFFAYFEDADLCMRYQQQQRRIVCVPQSRIWHAVSASTRRNQQEGYDSPLRHYLGMRNQIAMVLRYGTLWERMIFFALATPLRSLRYLSRFVWRRRWKTLVWFILGLVHGLQGRLGGPR